MPGPNSEPYAMRGTTSYSGKTALRRAKLKSGEGTRYAADYERRQAGSARVAAERAEKRARHVPRH